jgi:small subunit ribosomal protein S2
MIIRRALALARPSARRFLSTQVDSIEASSANGLKQLHSLEAQINATHAQSPPVAPTFNPDANGTLSALANSVAEQYHMFKQQRKPIYTTPLHEHQVDTTQRSG